MDTPLFSIIIPIYNAAAFLHGLMKQIQSQTEQDFEVIFINDCSSDNSAEILSQLSTEEERLIVLHHKEHRTQGAARNTGLDNAKGKYVLYVDADDSIPVNYLERLKNAIVNSEADIAICNSVWVYPDHEEKHNMFLKNQNETSLLLTGDEAREKYFHIYKDDIWIPVESWGRIVRRDLIEKNHIRFPETLFEDIVMSYAELLFSSKVLLLNDYLYYYNRKNSNAATLDRKRQYISDFPQAFEGIKNVLNTHNLYKKELKWLSRFYFRHLCGTYEFFAKGGHFPDEMRKAIEYYKELLPDPDLAGSEKFIYDHLLGFKTEMERNNMPEMYNQFLSAHPELSTLFTQYQTTSTEHALNRYLSVTKNRIHNMVHKKWENNK